VSTFALCEVSAAGDLFSVSPGSSPRILNICSGRPFASFFKTALARTIHDDSSRNPLSRVASPLAEGPSQQRIGDCSRSVHE